MKSSSAYSTTNTQGYLDVYPSAPVHVRALPTTDNWVEVIGIGTLSEAADPSVPTAGSFEELAVISVVARFFQYIPTCLAVILLRHRDQKNGTVASGFRVPLGATVPVLAMLCCLGLLIRSDPDRLAAGGAAFALGVPFYLVFCRKRR